MSSSFCKTKTYNGQKVKLSKFKENGMKKFRFIILFGLTVCCLFGAVGCKGEKLAAPGSFELDDHELILSWEEIENAQYYEININGETDDSKKNSCNLEKLEAGDYTIKVRACYDGKKYSNSVWSEAYEFTREEEEGIIYRLNSDGKSYEVANMGLAEGDVEIPSMYRNKPVTSIGSAAFRKKDKLKSITLPDTIVSIGSRAFINCRNLTKVNIPSSVQSIGMSAFNGCESLSVDLVIPEGIEVIEENAFAYCKEIKTIKLPSTLKTIEAYAFTSCEGVETIEFPDSLTEIKEYAFSDCFGLVDIGTASGVKTLGESSFRGCTALKSFKAGEKLETISEYAFYDCKALEKIEMSNSVETIENYVFYGCTSLNEVVLNSSLRKLGYLAFTGTKIVEGKSGLVYVDSWLVDFIGSENDKTEYFTIGNSEDYDYEIEDGTIGIAIGSFLSEKMLTDVVIPNSVKVIGEQSFAACENLAHVVIGSGTEYIDRLAFYGCKKLTDVFLSSYDFSTSKRGESSLKEIDSYAFYACESLRTPDIVVPESVTRIGSYAFRGTQTYNNTKTSIVYAGNWAVDYSSSIGNATLELADDTVGIADYAFYNCSYVKDVIIPESVVHFGNAMFYSCSVWRVNLPNNIKEIPNYAFSHCSNLFSVNFPDGLERIGKSAFYEAAILGCTVEDGYLVDSDEESIKLPDSLVSIGEHAFYGLGLSGTFDSGEEYIYGVDKIVFGNGVQTIGERAFYNCISVKELVFGNSLETIGPRAFYNCNALKTIQFGANVKTIGERAFYKCTSLTSLELPESLTKIEDYTFYRCSSLSSLVFKGAVTEIGKYAFYGCEKLEALYLPSTLASIGKYSFRNAKSLSSVTVSKTITDLPDHAFYGFSQATIYVEASQKPETWGTRWNSSFRPVVWGVTLSSDSSYVVSFVKSADLTENVNGEKTITAPTRKGYTFSGWTTVDGGSTAEYSCEDIMSLEDGTKLYAVWTEKIV